ncbi:hypothetical protein JW796_02385 [Candidatus Dojkabacteria bacterium]|nr:hypothetical protein [Candidatus Dojkabacteria bacterium]
MYRSVQQRDYKDIDELFKFYLEEIINKLDQIKKPPIINKEFNNIFGHHLNEETAWIKPGILDLNLDNFTINRKIIYNIDYEWTWNFPIPRDFVIFRGLYSLLDAIQSQGLDPSYIEDRIFSKYYKEQYLLAEDSFQNYINLTTSNRSSLSRIPKNIFSYSETPDLTERLTFLHNLERKTVEQQEELTSLRNQNEQLSEILSKNKHIIKVSQKTGLTKVINSLQKIKGKLSE